ncbi:MAG: hypothetical protein AB7G11_14590 [Phycisphaerales bacterium]
MADRLGSNASGRGARRPWRAPWLAWLFGVVSKQIASQYLDPSGGVIPFQQRPPMPEHKRTEHVPKRGVVRVSRSNASSSAVQMFSFIQKDARALGLSTSH